MHADGCDTGGCRGEREAGERRHDEAGGSFDLFGDADEEAYAWTQGSGVGVGGLGDDDAGFAGGGNVGDDTEVEPEAADVDGGGALALADDVGNGDLLGAEAFGDADSPVATDDGARDRGLGEDTTGRRGWRVEAVFNRDAEARAVGLLAGVCDGETGQIGDGDLAAVDGEAHGDEGGDKGDHKHGQGAEDQVEDALHGLGQDTGSRPGMISLECGKLRRLTSKRGSSLASPTVFGCAIVDADHDASCW
jgi:hypothetical protein